MHAKYLIPLLSLLLVSCSDDSTTIVGDENTTTDENVTVVDKNTTPIVVNSAILPKTGQTISYFPHDDGDYQVGTQREYKKTDSIVEDVTKNLFWQDDSAVMEKTFTQSEADSYCYNLIEDGYEDWRLPTIYEAFNLIDYANIAPSLDDAFKNTNAGYLWTSTPCPVCKDKVFAYDETEGSFASFSQGSHSFRVRCIRENNSIEKDFIRDDIKEVVIDNNTNLMWQDNNAVNWDDKRSLDEAINYCEALNLADYSDWRLPNIIELRSLLDFRGLTNSSHSPEFVNFGIDYWTSTAVAGTDSSKAWDVEFYKATSLPQLTDLWLSTRCVRINN